MLYMVNKVWQYSYFEMLRSVAINGGFLCLSIRKHALVVKKPPPEVKLNYVTDRIDEKMSSVTVEMGRPGLSTSLRDVQLVCMTHREAAQELNVMCDCGIFNPHRAEKIMKKMTRV